MAIEKLTQKVFLAELDGIRAVSIGLVLATHFLPIGPSYLQLNDAAGKMGMSLFFCLSGFLITKFLHESENVGEFFLRRAARIIPLLYLYAVIVSILLGGRWDSFAAITLFYLNYSDGALADNEGIGHLWSICVEAQFYIVIGLAVWMAGRKALWLIPVAALVVLILRVESGSYVSIRTHLRVDEILSGGILALIWLQANSRATFTFRRCAVTMFWLALPLWIVSSHNLGGPLNYLRPYFAMGIVGSIIFMPDGQIRRGLRHPWAAFVASISYSLYIWHPLMALGWFSEGGKLTLYIIKRPITLTLTFLAAYISSNTLEPYFRRLARRRKMTMG